MNMKRFLSYLLCMCLLVAGCTEIIYLPAEEYEDKYGQELEDKDEEEQKGKEDEEDGVDEKEEDNVTEDNGDFSDEDNTDEEDDSGVWNGMTVAARFDSGMGTKADPVIIKTPAQFALFANKVKNGESYSGIYFKLVSDINLNDIFWPYSGGSFAGHFDGNGKTLEGYNSDKGLFDSLYGSVSNLTMKGRIRASERNIGSVSGYTASDANIQNCVSFVHLSNSDENTGGFAGSSYPTTVVDCVFAGTVESSSDNVGGIVGSIYTKVKNSDFDVYGCCVDTMIDCINKGVVKGNNNVGGLIGSLKVLTDYTVFANYDNVSYLVMKECVNAGQVEGNDYVGGLVGYYYVEARGSYDYKKKDVMHSLEVKMANNLNLGDVRGLTFGGICGYIQVWGNIDTNKDADILYQFNEIKLHFDNCVNNSEGGFAGEFKNNYKTVRNKSYSSGKLVSLGYWLFDAVGGTGQQKAIAGSYTSDNSWYNRDASGCYLRGKDDLVQKLNDYVEDNPDDAFSKWQYSVVNGIVVPVLEGLDL